MVNERPDGCRPLPACVHRPSWCMHNAPNDSQHPIPPQQTPNVGNQSSNFLVLEIMTWQNNESLHEYSETNKFICITHHNKINAKNTEINITAHWPRIPLGAFANVVSTCPPMCPAMYAPMCHKMFIQIGVPMCHPIFHPIFNPIFCCVNFIGNFRYKSHKNKSDEKSDEKLDDASFFQSASISLEIFDIKANLMKIGWKIGWRQFYLQIEHWMSSRGRNRMENRMKNRMQNRMKYRIKNRMDNWMHPSARKNREAKLMYLWCIAWSSVVVFPWSTKSGNLGHRGVLDVWGVTQPIQYSQSGHVFFNNSWF